MRPCASILLLVACGGGGDDGIDPRLIPGGGVGDGDIDGNVFVHVIDAATDEPLVGATVAIGEQRHVTNREGLTEFGSVDGPQTIAVRMQGYRDTVWAYVNGTNVTIPVTAVAPETPRRATISGTITGWNPNPPMTRRAVIFYPGADTGFDAAFTGVTSCNTPPALACNWAVDLPPGPTILLAAIIEDAGIPTVIGWASKTVVVEEDSTGTPVNQTDVTLVPIDAGSLDSVTVDFGTPPFSLDIQQAVVGVEIADDLIIQVPFESDKTMLVPKPSLIAANASLRLTASVTGMGSAAKSVVLRRGLTGPTLAAGAWLAPLIGVKATSARASWQSVAGATLYQVTYDGLDIMVFDAAALSVDVPSSVAITPTGPLGVQVRAIGADFDPKHFSLKDVDMFASVEEFVAF